MKTHTIALKLPVASARTFLFTMESVSPKYSRRSNGPIPNGSTSPGAARDTRLAAHVKHRRLQYASSGTHVNVRLVEIEHREHRAQIDCQRAQHHVNAIHLREWRLKCLGKAPRSRQARLIHFRLPAIKGLDEDSFRWIADAFWACLAFRRDTWARAGHYVASGSCGQSKSKTCPRAMQCNTLRQKMTCVRSRCAAGDGRPHEPNSPVGCSRELGYRAATRCTPRPSVGLS